MFMKLAVRLCGDVAKTLLVVYVDRCGGGSRSLSSWCMEEDYTVEDRIVGRWTTRSSAEKMIRRGIILQIVEISLIIINRDLDLFKFYCKIPRIYSQNLNL